MPRSARTSTSLASGWDPESAYDEPASPSIAHESSSPQRPQRSSSHDEYNNPSPGNTPPPISSASDIHTTPSHRSSTANVSQYTRNALHRLYKRIYGHDSRRCLVTQSEESIIIAHIVQRASRPDQISLYEYCLGCEYQTFHVDSRRNLAYLEASWHTSFDASKWLLLPDLSTLQEVERFVRSVIAARGSNSTPNDTFLSKWSLDLKTTYTFMPLPRLAHQPVFRRVLNPSETWEMFPYPFNSFPPLECHISPPLAVINGGPKLVNLDLDAISLKYHGQESNETRMETKERLIVLRRIWGLFMDAKDLAKNWGIENRGKKRKRENDDKIEHLSQQTDRTTRSAAKSQRNSEPTPQAIQPKEISGTCKRGCETMSSSTTLTGDVLARLGKRQKTANVIKEWVESTSCKALLST